MAEETKTYYAKSAYSDPSTIINFVLGILALLMLPEFSSLIPPQYGKYVLLLSAVLNLATRTFIVRPVAYDVKPGDSKPVEVKAIDSSTDKKS